MKPGHARLLRRLQYSSVLWFCALLALLCGMGIAFISAAGIGERLPAGITVGVLLGLVVLFLGAFGVGLYHLRRNYDASKRAFEIIHNINHHYRDTLSETSQLFCQMKQNSPPPTPAE